MNARLSTLAVQQEFVKSDLQSKKKNGLGVDLVLSFMLLVIS